jgi:hypothetical protein
MTASITAFPNMLYYAAMSTMGSGWLLLVDITLRRAGEKGLESTCHRAG